MAQVIHILAPRGRDAAVIGHVLDRAGIAAIIDPDLATLVRHVADAAGIIITEEALSGPDLPALLSQVRQQPAWSDLSFIILATKQAGFRAGPQLAMLESLGNTLLLERPLNADTLGRAVQGVVRARLRQIHVRELNETLEQRVRERTLALHRSEAQLRAMFDGFPDCLFTIVASPGGHVFESVNGVAARTIGREALEICGFQLGQVMPPDSAALMAQQIEVSLATKTTVRYTVEVPGLNSAGPPALVQEIVITPLPDEHGIVTRLLGVARDVTARTLVEAQLRQAHKMEAIGQLTGGVAHDFNNLLQVVMSGLALLDRATDPARRTQLIESIRRAAARGGDLTKRLLTVARRQQLTPARLDLAAWFGEGVGDLISQALRGDISFTHRIEPDLPAIDVDPAELELALLNLAVNARDAMPDGGSLTLRATAVSVVGGDADGVTGDFVQIALQDTGTGMSAEIQRRVFEPFFTTKGIGQGTGLGLAHVYGFARQSGGTVRLESIEGQGTTVTVLLPLSRQVPPAQAKPPKDVPHPAKGWAVLVCEDNDDVAALVTDMLVQLGHATTRVANAAAALGALANNRPVDLLFTDVLMPGGMDGLALAREVRRRRPGLPVLLTTGYTGGGASNMPLGVPLLRKPYRLEDLAQALQRVMADVQES